MLDPVESGLVADCQAGDLRAFSQLFDHFQNRIYDLAYAILQDHAAAEDALQDTFLRVFEKIAHFRGEAGFETWLVAIAVNCCRDRIRRRQTRRWISLEGLAPQRLRQLLGGRQSSSGGQDPAAVAARRQERDSLWALVNRLDDRLRLPLILRYHYGLRCDETAAALGLTKGTVYGQLSEGRRRLRELLAAEQAANETAASQPGGEIC